MTTWKDIYRRLDPKEPLKAGDDRLDEKLYLNDFYDNIKETLLIEKDKNYKLLLSGHIGCGKSTFMNLLSTDVEIKNHFHLVYFSIKEMLDTEDVNHIDLLLAIVSKALGSIPKENYERTHKLQEKTEDIAKVIQGIIKKEIVSQDEEQSTLGTDTGVKIGFFDFITAKLFHRYRYENKMRETIREYYKPRVTDLIDTINSLLAEIRLCTDRNKELLILIDDTDKILPQKGLTIFHDNGHHIAAPNVNIVYVIDLSIATSTQFPAIKSKFSGDAFFPAIKIIEMDNKISDKTKSNVSVLKELVHKRMPADFIEHDALNKAIELTGGVVRELIRMLYYAVFHAKGKVSISNIEHARYKIMNDYNLYGKRTRIMKNIKDDPMWMFKDDEGKDENTMEIIMELLYGAAIFQYRNGDVKWYRPYPIFLEWLDELYPEKNS